MFDINVTVILLVSCIKSEISDWRTAAWFLKPSKQRIEENHYLWPSKTKFYKKNGTVQRVQHMLPSFFGKWKNGLEGQNFKLKLNYFFH